MDAANNPPMQFQDPPLRPVLATTTNIQPPQAYDGDMFLRDRPVHLDPEQIKVGIPVRFVGSEPVVDVTYPLPLQPNPLYNPTLPIQ